MADETEISSLAAPVDVASADRARVTILGVNAWAVLVALPLVLSGPTSWAGPALATLPLLALAAGVVSRAPAPRAGLWLLLLGFPLTLSVAVSTMRPLVEDPPHGTAGLLSGVLALWAYGAGALVAVGRPEERRPSTRRALGAVPPVSEPKRRKVARRALLGAAALAALLLSVVAPTAGGHAPFERAYGPAADAAGVLTAVVGGALGVALVALFVAPTMRAARRRRTRRGQLALRLTLFGLVVASGLLLLSMLAES